VDDGARYPQYLASFRAHWNSDIRLTS
jgi:hypothetical protein